MNLVIQLAHIDIPSRKESWKLEARVQNLRRMSAVSSTSCYSKLSFSSADRPLVVRNRNGSWTTIGSAHAALIST